MKFDKLTNCSPFAGYNFGVFFVNNKCVISKFVLQDIVKQLILNINLNTYISLNCYVLYRRKGLTPY